EILEPFLKENNLLFYDSVLEKEDGNLFLRVYLDKKGGITIDELALANEYLSERIDKYDNDLPEYFLEVSSPGAEKVLKNYEMVKENIDQYIHVELENMIYEGNLIEALDDGSITMRINAKGRFKKVTFNYEEVKLIRLAVKF
ncbi:MAG: ribosome maturation factor RimP, partial [Bacilli bacterium]|nr:ribosome maturation factor RimP [Bacilli bacterium]